MAQPIKDNSWTVLVVEDEPLIRLAAVELAEAQGFAVIEAQSADQAIAILENHPCIHIIFTDIHMAGSMDGLQLAAYARDRWPPIKFLIVSGEHSPEPEHMPAGALFFAKPYDGSTIGRALSTLAIS
jgi:two-component system, response regulator PdtaR